MLDRRLTHAVVAARSGSFTAAASAVGVTQSAITKSISDLERQLGYLIFDRTANGVMLTEKGRIFINRASRLLEDSNDLLEGRVQDEDPFAQTLRIGVGPSSLEWMLNRSVPALLRRYPNMKFDVRGSSFEQIVEQLRIGAVDVALGYDEAFAALPQFKRTLVPSAATAMFVRKDHPILSLPVVSFSDIAKYDLVSPSDSRPYESFVRDLYETHGVVPKHRLHFVDYFPLVERIVAATDAIGFSTVAYSKREDFLRRFERISGLPVFEPQPLCCATRLRWDMTPMVRAFIKALRDAAGPNDLGWSNARRGELPELREPKHGPDDDV